MYACCERLCDILKGCALLVVPHIIFVKAKNSTNHFIYCLPPDIKHQLCVISPHRRN